MLTIAEAWEAIEGVVEPLPRQRVPLAESLGLVLAENIVADLDSPPFDKALMDGYAVRAADVATLPVRLQVAGEVLAGQVSARGLAPGEAIRIMTGAPLPAGTDLVIPVEQSALEGATVTLQPPAVPVGRNVLRRGESTRQGAVVVPAGRVIRAVEVGCLAEVGQHSVPVHRAPRIAVLATGDELVPVSDRPGPGQIRNSNEAMLVAQLQQAGYAAYSLGIARDNAAELKRKIMQGLEYDVLVLSGGVSAGKVDLVPLALAETGVETVFHKVKIRPGQPLYFGRLDRSRPANRPLLPGSLAANRPNAWVFGLPGNPVSSLVCCELFVKPALRRLAGLAEVRPQPLYARLQQSHFNGGQRPTYHPARLTQTPSGPEVTPVRWIGSADLSATASANGMIAFEVPNREYAAGEWVAVYPW
jgi:molybdopterin molybdotransferase